MAPVLVVLGRLGRAHGVHGEIRLLPYNAGSALLTPGSDVVVGGTRTRIRAARPAGDMLVVALDGVDTREAAEGLTGAEISVPRDALPPPGPGELYLADLVGCACFEGGAALGEVVGVVTYPASTCLVVQSAEGTREVPAVAPYFAGVDLAARRIEIAHASDFPVERARPKKPPRSP